MLPSLVHIFVYYFVIIHIPALSTNYFHSSNYMSKSSKDAKLRTAPHYLKVPTNVTAVEGADVILSCRIENLNDQMVFWIRNSDLQILTAGLMTFSSDARFRVNHENSVDEKDWSLLISNVRHEDEGLYECQINTEPKMKLNVNLMVKELTEMMEMDSPFHHHFGATIEGKNLNVLKKGQTITLKCRVVENDGASNHHNENAKRIDWLKDGEPTRNGGTTIDTIWVKTSGTSRLTLSMLQPSDEGNYSCRSGEFHSDDAMIRIVPDSEGSITLVPTRILLLFQLLH